MSNKGDFIVSCAVIPYEFQELSFRTINGFSCALINGKAEVEARSNGGEIEWRIVGIALEGFREKPTDELMAEVERAAKFKLPTPTRYERKYIDLTEDDQDYLRIKAILQSDNWRGHITDHVQTQADADFDAAADRGMNRNREVA